MPDERHILVVRTDRMGDMIVTTPLFAAIKAAFPACRLTVLASAAGVPYVARVIPLPFSLDPSAGSLYEKASAGACHAVAN